MLQSQTLSASHVELARIERFFSTHDLTWRPEEHLHIADDELASRIWPALSGYFEGASDGPVMSLFSTPQSLYPLSLAAYVNPVRLFKGTCDNRTHLTLLSKFTTVSELCRVLVDMRGSCLIPQSTSVEFTRSIVESWTDGCADGALTNKGSRIYSQGTIRQPLYQALFSLAPDLDAYARVTRHPLSDYIAPDEVGDDPIGYVTLHHSHMVSLLQILTALEDTGRVMSIDAFADHLLVLVEAYNVRD